MRSEYEYARIELEELIVSLEEGVGSVRLADAARLAIDALRKQDPMKLIHKEKNLYCPNCDHWLLWDDAIPNEWDNYCGICGQKLDWED